MQHHAPIITATLASVAPSPQAGSLILSFRARLLCPCRMPPEHPPYARRLCADARRARHCRHGTGAPRLRDRSKSTLGSALAAHQGTAVTAGMRDAPRLHDGQQPSKQSQQLGFACALQHDTERCKAARRGPAGAALSAGRGQGVLWHWLVCVAAAGRRATWQTAVVRRSTDRGAWAAATHPECERCIAPPEHGLLYNPKPHCMRQAHLPQPSPPPHTLAVQLLPTPLSAWSAPGRKPSGAHSASLAASLRP